MLYIYLRYNKNILKILSGRVRVDRVERGHAGQPRAGRVHPRDHLPAAPRRHSRHWLEVTSQLFGVNLLKISILQQQNWLIVARS